MSFPLPEWIENFYCLNYSDEVRAKDTLRLAWKALATIAESDPQGLGYPRKIAKEAMNRIREEMGGRQ